VEDEGVMKCTECGTELVMLITGACPMCAKTVTVRSDKSGSRLEPKRHTPCCGTCKLVAIKDDDGLWCSKHDFRVYELNRCDDYEKAEGKQ
jgi:hypothetical protein